MTVKRYDTPNHPRWYSETTGAPTRATASQRRDEHVPPSDDGRRTDTNPRAEPASLLSSGDDADDAPIELRQTPERLWITTELPDCSLDEDDVRVSVRGASVRIRVEPQATSSQSSGIDRTLALADPVDVADVAVIYDETTLIVLVSTGNR